MTHYFDNAATTRVRPEAIDVMVEMLQDGYGNPSGAHSMARAANRVLDEARDQIAAAVGALPGEVVFTSGGTEADNLAVRGVTEATGKIALCSAIEHHAVLDPTIATGGRVFAVTADGRADLDSLRAEIMAVGAENVGLVSLMVANNETGIVQPLEEAVALVRAEAPDAVIHTDAVQALCWVDLASVAANVDLISISAHKFGGPKGVGALIVRPRAKLATQMLGGGQERERRGGTQNVPGIAAMARAATLTVAERPQQLERVRKLRERLRDGVLNAIADVYESGATPNALGTTGPEPERTGNVCHLCIDGLESEALLFLLERSNVMASAASSCASGAMDPSHVLAAMGVPRSLAAGSLRLSLGYTTTEADVDAAIDALIDAVARLRRLRPAAANVSEAP